MRSAFLHHWPTVSTLHPPHLHLHLTFDLSSPEVRTAPSSYGGQRHTAWNASECQQAAEHRLSWAPPHFLLLLYLLHPSLSSWRWRTAAAWSLGEDPLEEKRQWYKQMTRRLVQCSGQINHLSVTLSDQRSDLLLPATCGQYQCSDLRTDWRLRPPDVTDENVSAASPVSVSSSRRLSSTCSETQGCSCTRAGAPEGPSAPMGTALVHTQSLEILLQHLVCVFCYACRR